MDSLRTRLSWASHISFIRSCIIHRSSEYLKRIENHTSTCRYVSSPKKREDTFRNAKLKLFPRFNQFSTIEFSAFPIVSSIIGIGKRKSQFRIHDEAWRIIWTENCGRCLSIPAAEIVLTERTIAPNSIWFGSPSSSMTFNVLKIDLYGANNAPRCANVSANTRAWNLLTDYGAQGCIWIFRCADTSGVPRGNCGLRWQKQIRRRKLLGRKQNWYLPLGRRWITGISRVFNGREIHLQANVKGKHGNLKQLGGALVLNISPCTWVWCNSFFTFAL